MLGFHDAEDLGVSAKMTAITDLAQQLVVYYLRGANDQPVTLGIDGPDCAGKSTLAREIAAYAADRRVAAQIIHGDDYLFSEAERMVRGEFSVESFMCNYFDWERLCGQIRNARYGSRSGIIVVEGLFLMTPRIRALLDVVIRLEISEPEVMRRALTRDVGHLGSRSWVSRHYTLQCLPSQRIYKHILDPGRNSDWVIDCGAGISDMRVIRGPDS